MRAGEGERGVSTALLQSVKCNFADDQCCSLMTHVEAVNANRCRIHRLFVWDLSRFRTFRDNYAMYKGKGGDAFSHIGEQIFAAFLP